MSRCPPPPTPLRYLTETSWDVLWVAAVAVLVVAYLLGVRRLAGAWGPVAGRVGP